MDQNQTTHHLINDRQWQIVQAVIPPSPASQPLGRPPVPDRACLDGILYVIVNHIPWMYLPPDQFTPYATCFRRYTAWVKNGSWEAILFTLFDDLSLRTGVDLWREWSRWTLASLKSNSTGRKAPFRIPATIREDPYDYTIGMLFLRSITAMAADDLHRKVKI